MGIIAPKPITERKPGPLPANRRCRHRDANGSRCPTILNRYHDSDRCYLHAESKVVSLTEKIAPTTEELMDAA